MPSGISLFKRTVMFSYYAFLHCTWPKDTLLVPWTLTPLVFPGALEHICREQASIPGFPDVLTFWGWAERSRNPQTLQLSLEPVVTTGSTNL